MKRTGLFLSAAAVLALSFGPAVGQLAPGPLPAVAGPNGPLISQPVINVGYDTNTGLPCLVGKTATCSQQGSGGGGTSSLAPWTPDNGSLTTAAPTGTSSLSTAFSGSGTVVYVKNIGTVAVHVRPVLTSGTALVTDERLQPGMCGPFARGTADRLALITDSGTGSVEITTGTGNPGFGICTNLASASAVVGSAPLGSADDGLAPVKTGGVAKSADPAAVTAGNPVNRLCDTLGKCVSIPALRAQKGHLQTTITASASETPILAAGASGVFDDVYALILDNTSASAGHCDIKDATAGTTQFSFDVAAASTGGFTLEAGSAFAQTASASAWTATCTSLSSWKITILYVATKG